MGLGVQVALAELVAGGAGPATANAEISEGLCLGSKSRKETKGAAQ